MKYVLPAPLLPTLAVLVCALTACRTTSNRFDLYQMDRPHGPGTTRLRGMTLGGRYNHNSSITIYKVNANGATPAATGETGPIAPPPPVPPSGSLPESNSGAPQPTPLPMAVPVVPPPPAASGQVIPPSTPPATTAPNGGLVPPPEAAPAGATPPAAPPADSSASPAPAIPGLSQ